jgi:DNA modification methylase
MTLIHGDCLIEMAKLKDDSIDLLFCDLPYGQTSCSWDCLIDLTKFWKEVNRICKDTTPMFFCCSTKFGVSLINSNPKNFRYDMVWVKSSPCGFLNAKKMPMKKHEMLYVFYRKLPYYDLSSHKHKFVKVDDPPLPTSVITETKPKKTRKTPKQEEGYGKEYLEKKPNYREINPNLGATGTDSHIYDPALPTSILKEETFIRGKDKASVEDVYHADERMNTGKLYHHSRQCQKGDDPIYEPALPTSILREVKLTEESLYGVIHRPDFMARQSESNYNPALPTTVLRQSADTECYDGNITYNYEDREGAVYEPPLPNTILEIRSEKGRHATQKPTALIEWCLKYYSKEGDTVLDPTMGSGSTGIACAKMNRKFIGIEMDEIIYESAKKRVSS